MVALLVVAGCTVDTETTTTSHATTTSASARVIATSTTTGTEVVDPKGLPLELVTDRLTVPRNLIDLGEGRMLLSDQIGLVLLVEDGRLLDEPFLDITDGVLAPRGNAPELGMTGFAISPDFASTGRVYAFYTAPPDDDSPRGTQRVDTLTEWTVSADDPNRVDPGSKRTLFALPWRHRDHIGEIIFDEDGKLLIGIGAPSNSPEAQDPHTLLGSIIRIDVDGDPYSIPADNPFADGRVGAPELYSYGYRNPFRFSSDPTWGVLVSLPMFNEKYQQVNVVLPGVNAGYPEMPQLVDSCFQGDAVATQCLSTPEGGPLQPPVAEYGPDVGSIVSGALIYRGSGLPDLEEGTALITDWRGKMLAATPTPDGAWSTRPIEVALPSGFGFLWAIRLDSAGQVYLMTTTFTEGAVYRFVEH